MRTSQTTNTTPALPAPPRIRVVQRFLLALIVLNTLTFFIAALSGRLNVQGRALVFVDFWGRLTVYSLWFILYAAYRHFAAPVPALRWVVGAAVLLNIPLFLLLAYFEKISNAPEILVYVDFWGRVTVYSLWFIAYEAYRVYVTRDRSVAAV